MHIEFYTRNTQYATVKNLLKKKEIIQLISLSLYRQSIQY